MSAERLARLLVIVLLVGLPVAVFGPGRALVAPPGVRTIEVHGVMAESGGWAPAALTATAGEPLHLRLTSDDVVHGFAIGQMDLPAVDVEPGKYSEVTLQFDRPGKYTYYCTRWCGPNHWRMRGTIEVTGPGPAAPPAPEPLYVTLGIDIDAPHPATTLPVTRPSAERGAALGVALPAEYLSRAFYRMNSPAAAWERLRVDAVTAGLSDLQVWDLLALAWQSQATPAAAERGRALYAGNCAACHGESGAGDGVMASSLGDGRPGEFGQATKKPVNFTDAGNLLGASPALLQGKIVRGGMGTGMPYWGPVFTEEQTWDLVAYLWTLHFDR